MSESQEGHPTEHSTEIVGGWPPLVLGGDGNIYTPEGILIKPDHYVGPEKWHKQMFIEYERTFGRGLAKRETHIEANAMSAARRVFERKYGEGYGNLMEDYRKIMNEYFKAMEDGPEKAEEIKSKIQGFRRHYPKLYKDVNQPQTRPSVKRLG